VRSQLVGVVLLACAAKAAAIVLAPFLQSVADNARAPSAVRADVVLARGDERTAAVLLLWRDRLYLETAGGFRALMRNGKAVVVDHGHPVRAPVRTAIPGTEVLVEDLPFAGVPLAFPQIHDEGPDEVVIGGAPAVPSLYVLIVQSIEPEKKVVVTTKYYKDDIASLFQMRRDDQFLDVEGHWRPGTIEIQDFTEQTTTKLQLAWKLAPELPRALFTPHGLTRPSGLTIAPPG
jgi:hypothetical protein